MAGLLTGWGSPAAATNTEEQAPSTDAEAQAPSTDAEAQAPSTDAETYESLLARGSLLVEQEQDLEGATKLEEAYTKMPLSLRLSELGRHTVEQSAQAYIRAWEDTGDTEVLRKSEQVLTDYFRDANANRDDSNTITEIPASERTLIEILQFVQDELSPAPESRPTQARLIPPPPPPPPPPPASIAAESDGSDAQSDSDLAWGKYSPRPKWKWAAFGASAGVLAVSAISLPILAARIKASREDLLQAAAESLLDDNPINDIDPARNIDLCEDAYGDATDPRYGTVKNAEVSKVCNKGTSLSNFSIAAGTLLAVGLVSTTVFTTLLFVHKRKPTMAALRRRGLRLGVAPTTRGGLAVSGRLRF